ncbi:MAG: AP2 domain-containing protein [Phycisphaerae bacterium]|jgi:hypothetical protein
MPKLYLHIPPIPYFLPTFIMRIGVWILLRHRIKKYGFAFRRIKLTSGKSIGTKPAETKYAIVDAEDYEKLNCYNWQCLTSRSTFYAVRLRLNNEKAKIMRMHREIMQAPKGMVVDHIDHDGLNNCKSNLRIATPSENRRNSRKAKGTSSKFKGVCWHKSNKKWSVGININGRRKHLGSFDNEAEAAKTYDKAVKKYHGEFAVLNFEETDH